MQKTIAVIGALEKEVALINDAIEHACAREEAGLTAICGQLDDCRVVATTAGMGTVNAAATTQYLITEYKANVVLFSGIAGGLNPQLHISDVVVGNRLRYLDTDTKLIAESAPGTEEYASDPQLVQLAEQVLAERGYVPAGAVDAGDKLQYLRGTIATGDRFVSGNDMKSAVIAATQADCVEMEGAAVAHVAAKNGVPCLVLRAISDNCDEAYDALSARTFDLETYAQSANRIVLDIIARIAAA